MKILATVLLASLLLVGCKDDIFDNGFKTCWSDGDWKLCYSKNVRLDSKDPPIITMKGSAEPHYLVKAKRNISEATQFIIRYKVEVLEGVPYFRAKDCDTNKPATIAAFFQRKDDDMTAQGLMQFYRWWSRHRPNLEIGEHEMVVSLDPSKNHWISVYGKGSEDFPTQFNNAKKYSKQIGVTFGGCKGAGHGILVQEGKAKITIQEVILE